MKTLKIKFRSYMNIKTIKLAMLLALAGCSTVPDQPIWLGDNRTQETEHHFKSALNESLIKLFKDAYKANNFSIKETNASQDFITATLNTSNGFINSTTYFYPSNDSIKVKIVTTASTTVKVGINLNESIIEYVILENSKAVQR